MKLPLMHFSEPKLRDATSRLGRKRSKSKERTGLYSTWPMPFANMLRSRLAMSHHRLSHRLHHNEEELVFEDALPCSKTECDIPSSSVSEESEPSHNDDFESLFGNPFVSVVDPIPMARSSPLFHDDFEEKGYEKRYYEERGHEKRGYEERGFEERDMSITSECDIPTEIPREIAITFNNSSWMTSNNQVSINDCQNRVYVIERFTDPENIWHSREEYNIMKVRDRVLIKLAQEGRFFDSDHDLLLGLENDIEDSDVYDDAELSRNIVFLEQERQRRAGKNDPEEIAVQYTFASWKATKLALERAQQAIEIDHDDEWTTFHYSRQKFSCFGNTECVAHSSIHSYSPQRIDPYSDRRKKKTDSMFSLPAMTWKAFMSGPRKKV